MRGFLLASLLLTSCARPRLSIVATPSNEYIDLRPGQRLRAVTPILRSGGYQLRPSNPTPPGATFTVQTDGEFLGYEQAFYDVAPGLRISFSSAETIIDGISRPQPVPLVPLFPLPGRGTQQVRLLYLVRSSAADHNMAILAAPDLSGLQSLTAAVHANPSTACVSSKRVYCAWVPAGIALRPL